MVEPHEGRARLLAARERDDRKVADGRRTKLKLCLAPGREDDEDGRLRPLGSKRRELAIERAIASLGRAVVTDGKLEVGRVLEGTLFAVVGGQLREAFRVETREVSDRLARACSVDGDDLGRRVGREEADNLARVMRRVIKEEETDSATIVEVGLPAELSARPLELVKVKSSVEAAVEATLDRLVKRAGRAKLEKRANDEWNLRSARQGGY